MDTGVSFNVPIKYTPGSQEQQLRGEQNDLLGGPYVSGEIIAKDEPVELE